MKIKRTVNYLIRRCHTNDPLTIAKELGIIVLTGNLGSLWGFCMTSRRFRFIWLNENLDEPTLRYTCAHELGHAVLHKGISIPYLHAHTFFTKGIFEQQANTFAAELLLPDSLLHEYPNCSIYDLARMEGLPEELVELKR